MLRKMVPILAVLLLLAGCTAKYTVQEESHYKTYSDVTMTQIGSWTPMDIHIPRGALVAIMAEGELWNVKDPQKKHLNPKECLKFKIGEDGAMRGLSPVYGSEYVNVVKSTREGSLYYHIGSFLKEKGNRRAKMTATVIVWARGQLDNVEADIQELALAHPDEKKYKALLFPLAGCFTQIGEYSEAEMVLKRLREAEGKQGREAVIALNMSSENEKWLRRYDKTREYAEESLEISIREGYKGLQGEALLSLSNASFNLGQPDEAVKLAEQVLQLSSKMRPANPYLAGRAHLELAVIHLNANRVPAGLQHSKKAVQNLQKARTWRPLAQSHFFLGQAQRRSNLKEEAKSSYESAINIAGSIGRSETIWRAHSQLGRMADVDGNTGEAFEHYAEAINTIETMRGELSDPSLKSLFMEDKFFVYEWMIQLLHKMKRDEEALYYLERAKARIMLDMLRDKMFASGDKDLNALLSRERSLREQVQEFARASGQVSPEEADEEDDEEAVPESRRDENPELKRLQSELQSVVRKIEQLNPDLASLLTVKPLRADEIQALIDDDAALLAYFISSEMNAVFIVTREKVTGIEIPARRKEIMGKVKEFRTQTDEGVSVKLFTSRDYEKSLTDLYEILIKPVEGEIAGKRHLVVVPHGMLHYLPFQALRSHDGRYLIDSFTVSYLPSASVLKYARMKNKGNHQDFLAAANPVTDLAPLPAAEVEAREVSALFEKKLVLIGPGATKKTVKSEGPRYDLLLFSTHGEMIESDPLKSNLRFTPTPQDDGKLTVSEIFDMEVKANLVTLSACETGLARGTKGDLPQGDDLVGLSRAFIHAGAPSVVASLWRVSDDSTVAMMRSFYRNLSTRTKAEALRLAQLELAESSGTTYSHPFFWAPFILVGDWK